MEAQRLPVDVLKHACNLRNTQAYVGSLVQITFLHKLEKEGWVSRHKEQMKERAGGLFVDHPGYWHAYGRC